MDPKQIITDGYDRLGSAFSEWASGSPPDVRSWFLDEVLEKLPEGTDVLELGCGPGTAATELSLGRSYVGVDLSPVQLSIARRRVPEATFVRADFTSIAFKPASFDGVVAFYVFNHVPQDELAPTFARIFDWLRPGGRLMLSLGASDNAGAIEEDWLGRVPMFFASFSPEINERLLIETGFDLELSSVRDEVEAEPGGGQVVFHWVIARKADG